MSSRSALLAADVAVAAPTGLRMPRRHVAITTAMTEREAADGHGLRELERDRPEQLPAAHPERRLSEEVDPRLHCPEIQPHLDLAVYERFEGGGIADHGIIANGK